MKAITTRYVGPTNKRGSVIIAKTEGNPSVRVPYDCALSADENHAKAIRVLCERMRNDSWTGEWIGSTLPDGKTDVWVCSTRNDQIVTVP